MDADKEHAVFNLRASAFICGFICLSLICGCERNADDRRVVLYTSIDQPIAAKVVKKFEERSGMKVTLVTDTEATKSVGLAERLRAERANPRADVWWGNEPFHTINLADDGLLAPYDSPARADVADRMKAARWTANAYRVRVVASKDGHATRLDDLLDEKYHDKVAIARPSAGTTGGHVAALYVLWGDERADGFLRKVRSNGVKLLGGNGPVADAVGSGSILAGLTDNDDVANVRREGGKIEMALPDQDTIGTLLVPTTIGLVSGSQSEADAKKLIDFLLSREVEQMLIDEKFAYGSVREMAKIKAMDVDYTAVAKKLPEAVRRATSILEGRE